MRKLFSGVVVIATIAACSVSAKDRPVMLVSSPPTLVAGRVWQAQLRVAGRGTPLLLAGRAGRTLRFRTRRVAPHLFRAAVRISVPGRWRLSARVRGRTFFLGAVRVVAPNAEYRLFEPAQVLATPSGVLLVAERGTRNQVVVVDPSTGRVTSFARGLPQPYGLAFAPDRFVLVSTVDGLFRVPSHGGTPVRIADGELGPILQEAPPTILYGSRTELGRIDVASRTRHVLTRDVSLPHTLSRASDGRLVVTDSGNNRVVAVDSDTGALGVIAAGLSGPLGMAVEPSGDLLVSEFFTGSLLRITPGGRRTRITDRLARPYALTRMPDGTVYVVEAGQLGSASGRLRRVSPEGAVTTVRLRRA